MNKQVRCLTWTLRVQECPIEKKHRKKSEASLGSQAVPQQL